MKYVESIMQSYFPKLSSLHREAMNVPVAPPPPPPPALPEIKTNLPGEEFCFEQKPISLQEFQDTLIHSCNVEGGGFTIKTAVLLDNYLQKGPICGIVSLSTACKLSGKAITPDEVLRKAKDKNFSTNGEMFSVINMASLAQDYLQNVKIEIGPPEKLFDCVNCGGIVLIAYDADKNHSPCLKRGHKAHWAVIYGVATRNQESNENIFAENAIERNGILYVVAGQGKSGKPSLWKLEELIESNLNLVESDIVPNIQLREMFITVTKTI